MHKDCVLFPCETVNQEGCCIRDCGRYKSRCNPTTIAIFHNESFGVWCKFQSNQHRLSPGCNLTKNYCSALECPIIIESLKKYKPFYSKYLK